MLQHIGIPKDVACWIILISAFITGLTATMGIVLERYKEGLIETFSLTAVAFSAVIVVMQITSFRSAQQSGLVFFVASVGAYALLSAIKMTRIPQHHRQG